MKRLDSLKYVQYFDAHNSNQKKGKKKRKYLVYNFCNITKHSDWYYNH